MHAALWHSSFYVHHEFAVFVELASGNTTTAFITFLHNCICNVMREMRTPSSEDLLERLFLVIFFLLFPEESDVKSIWEIHESS